jgi:hypothetical protein
MCDLTRREALRLASAAGLASMGPPIARAADEPKAIPKRWWIAYEQAVLADHPVAYWRLGESSGPVAVDATGHGHNGIYHGHITYGEAGVIQGEPNTAIGLHGKEYVEIPDSVHFSQPESHQGLTVEVWMRPDELDFPGQRAHPNDDPYVYWLGKGEKGEYEWGFRMYSLHKDEKHQQLSSRPNRISAYIWNPTTLPGRAENEGAGAYFQDKLVKGRWIYIVACYQPGDRTNPKAGVQIYKDGRRRQGPPFPPTLYSDPKFWVKPAHGTAPLRLGTRDLGSFLRGGLDEVAIYPYVLSAPQIQNHYEAAGIPLKEAPIEDLP